MTARSKMTWAQRMEACRTSSSVIIETLVSANAIARAELLSLGADGGFIYRPSKLQRAKELWSEDHYSEFTNDITR